MIAAIKDLHQHVGQTVTLQGWLYNRRDSGKVAFLIIRDGSGLCQCVVTKSPETDAFFDIARRLGQETSLRITGKVLANEKQLGGHELEVSGLEVVGLSQDYPITPKPHGVDFLMKNRHLHFRSRRQWHILRVRSTLIDEIRSYFNRNGYTLIDTPIFAPAAGEGAQTLFEVDYFGEPVYLAQTGQLYVETACMSHGKVYCFGPTFRAEKSKTRRHLTEFWMVEPEIAFADLAAVVDVAEDFICSIVDRILRDHREDLEFLGRDIASLERIQKPFVRMTYTEAADLLHSDKVRKMMEADLEAKRARAEELRKLIAEKDAESDAQGVKQWKKDKLVGELMEHREELEEVETDIRNIPHHIELAAGFEWGKDLGGSDETVISRLNERPTFVTHYPRSVKAFYMKKNEQDDRIANNFDMLAPEGYGEIIGGSQREDSYEELLAQIDREKLDRADYEWYLDLRKYGTVPHGGFGLGVERTLSWLCGLKHVRETIPFPRMMGKFYP